MVTLADPQTSLSRLLRDLTPESLETLAEHLGLAVKRNESASSVRQRILDRLTDEKFIQKQIKALGDGEKDILISAVLGSGLLRETEADPNFRELSEGDQRRIRISFNALRLSGLMIGAEEVGYHFGEDRKIVFVLPAEVRRRLDELLMPRWVRQKLTAAPNSLVPRSCEEAFWPNLDLLTTDLARSELRIKSDGKFFKKDLERLQEQVRLGMIPNPEDFSIEMERKSYTFDLREMVAELSLTGLQDFGIAAALDGKMTVSRDRLRDWNQMGPYLHGRLLIRYLFAVGPYSRPLCYRNLLKLGFWAPEDRVIRVDNLLDTLMTRHRDVYGFYGRVASDYLEKEILLTVIALYLTGLLYLWMDERGRLKGVCLTPYARNILRKNRDAFTEQKAPDERPLYVQANYEGYAPAGLRFETRIKLNEAAEILSANKTLHFRITAQSIYRARQLGSSVEGIVGFFASHCAKPLPQNVEFSIRDWGAKFGEVAMMEATVLRCQTPEMASEIACGQKFSACVEGLLDHRTVAVKKDKAQEMMGLLLSRGYMPDQIVHQGLPKHLQSPQKDEERGEGRSAPDAKDGADESMEQRSYALFKQALAAADRARNQLPPFRVKQIKREPDRPPLKIRTDGKEPKAEAKPKAAATDAPAKPPRARNSAPRKPAKKWEFVPQALDLGEKIDLFQRAVAGDGVVEFDYARSERGKVERQRLQVRRVFQNNGGHFVEGLEEMMGETQSYDLLKILKIQRYAI